MFAVLSPHSVYTYNYTCSLPAGLLLQGMDRLLIGKQKKEEMKREKYKLRQKKLEQWLAYIFQSYMYVA